MTFRIRHTQEVHTHIILKYWNVAAFPVVEASIFSRDLVWVGTSGSLSLRCTIVCVFQSVSDILL